jgi:aspartate-semialdehyde dehydrogenase
MKIAIIGATGIVGRTLIKVIEEMKLPITDLFVAASKNSVGKKIVYNKRFYDINSIDKILSLRPNIALFSAGGYVSKKWAPIFSNLSITVIDNSSIWRMDPKKKLIIPEINAQILSQNDKIITNPNCSTIQLLMVLYPLKKIYGIKRVVISTYQSVTGTGKKAMDQLKSEIHIKKKYNIYPYSIYKNAIPQCDEFEYEGYTKEELKLIREQKKIINDNTISITATSVRIPVIGGHSESVNITFNKYLKKDEIRKTLFKVKGIIVQDNKNRKLYPMPIYAKNKDEVFIGRIRIDLTCKNSITIWIVSDNLRKGAATNAIQISEYIINKNLLP